MPTRANFGFLLSDASRLVRRAFESALEGTGITLAQARALVRLKRCEGVRQVELAELLEIRPITLTRLIDQLAASGLVERRADEQDRRAFRLHLTAQAQPVLERIAEVGEQVLTRGLAGLSADEIDCAGSVMETLRLNLAGR